MTAPLSPPVLRALRRGVVIPACPLALTTSRKLDERRQRALFRYYIAAGAGGLAVGVHTTQFAIRDPKVGMFKPVLELAAEEMKRADKAVRAPDKSNQRQLVRIGGVCGYREQALREASLIPQLGYNAALLKLGALNIGSEKWVP